MPNVMVAQPAKVSIIWTLQPSGVTFMAALRSRYGHYIFALWFLSSSFFFSSPTLGGRRLDVYHTSIPHMVWS